MVTDIYTGTAKLSDGTEVQITGSIMECANWADNMIRISERGITIEIRRNE